MARKLFCIALLLFQWALSDHAQGVKFENNVNGNVRGNDVNLGRGQGMGQKYTKPNGVVSKIQIIGGQNSTPRPIIKVTPYKWGDF